MLSDYLKEPLDKYMSRFPKVRIIRLKERQGLIRARLAGAAAAKGNCWIYRKCVQANFVQMLHWRHVCPGLYGRGRMILFDIYLPVNYFPLFKLKLRCPTVSLALSYTETEKLICASRSTGAHYTVCCMSYKLYSFSPHTFGYFVYSLFFSWPVNKPSKLKYVTLRVVSLFSVVSPQLVCCYLCNYSILIDFCCTRATPRCAGLGLLTLWTQTFRQ